MSGILESLLSICAMAAAVELLSGLCAKNTAVDLVKALVILVLLTSAVVGAFSGDWDFFEPRWDAETSREELTEYVEEQTVWAAEEQTAVYLTGLLEAAGIQTEKIRPIIHIEEDGSIVLRKVDVVCPYASEGERAAVLLRNTLGKETEVEVVTDGR